MKRSKKIIKKKKVMAFSNTFLIAILLVSLNLVFAGFEDYSYGGRINKIYVPTGSPASRPLYVMLHGCTQDPTDFAKGLKNLYKFKTFFLGDR